MTVLSLDDSTKLVNSNVKNTKVQILHWKIVDKISTRQQNHNGMTINAMERLKVLPARYKNGS